MNSLKLILSKVRYFAPAWVFASLNILFGTWVLYIPYVKQKLEITDGQLGVALFFLSLGTLIMIPIAPFIINRFGVGKMTFYGIMLLAVFFQFPLLMDSYLLLCVSLFMVGMSASLTDISMNALVSEIEQEDNVHFMSASHGFFSLGGVLGAGIGSLLIMYFAVPSTHMLLAMSGVVITNLILAGSYYKLKGRPIEKGEEGSKKIDIMVFRSLFGLALIALIIYGSEGAIEHWSKLYMQDIVLVTSESVAGYGFVAFSAMMTLGRFLGDSISAKFGAYTIIMGGCIIAILGFIILLQSTVFLSILGFSLIGLGYSVIVPELFRLAGKSKSVTPATGISFVAGLGYAGFLASPPIMGFLSEIGTLTMSFQALLGTTILVMIVSLVLRVRRA